MDGLKRPVQEKHPAGGRVLVTQPSRIPCLQPQPQPILVAWRVVPLERVPNVDALVLRLHCDDLLFVDHLEGTGHPVRQVRLPVEVMRLPRVLGAEAAKLVRPQRNDLLLLPCLLVDPGNSKQLLDLGKHREERLLRRGEEVESDDPLVGPRVERDVRLEQHPHAGHPRGVEGVAVVRKHGEPPGLHGGLHGVSEAGLGVEEGRLEVLDVHQEVLPGGIALVAQERLAVPLHVLPGSVVVGDVPVEGHLLPRPLKHGRVDVHVGLLDLVPQRCDVIGGGALRLLDHNVVVLADDLPVGRDEDLLRFLRRARVRY
mmetsp:Transcript_13597/g.29439  ORF Transcript_13597/g.29439 Transcript_13597/m.29439 type:complete len:314 (-) Transcript_13597:519-1460(-)